MMNAGHQGRSEPPSLAGETRIEENAYFDDYAAGAMESMSIKPATWISARMTKVATRVEFDSYNPAWLIADWSYQDNGAGAFAAVGARTLDLLHTHIKNYTGYFLVRGILAARAPLVASQGDEERSLRSMWLLPRFDVPGFTRWFDDFTDAVLRSDRGALWFAPFHGSPLPLSADEPLRAGRGAHAGG